MPGRVGPPSPGEDKIVHLWTAVERQRDQTRRYRFCNLRQVEEGVASDAVFDRRHSRRGRECRAQPVRRAHQGYGKVRHATFGIVLRQGCLKRRPHPDRHDQDGKSTAQYHDDAGGVHAHPPDVAQYLGVEGAHHQDSSEGLAGDELGALILQNKSYRFLPRQVSPFLVEVSAEP